MGYPRKMESHRFSIWSTRHTNPRWMAGSLTFPAPFSIHLEMSSMVYFSTNMSSVHDIPLPDRHVGAVFDFEEDGAGGEALEGVPLAGGDVEEEGAGGHVDDLRQASVGIVEVLLEVTAEADDRLGGGRVPMDGQDRARLDGVQHALGAIGRRIPQVQVHPQPRRRLRPRRQFVQGCIVDDHRPFVIPDLDRESLLVLIHIHRILVVIFAVEVDLDIDVVLGAVDLDSAVLGRRFLELRDLGGTGIGQFIRVLVQRIPVQPMRQGIRVILRKHLFHKRIGILFQLVDARSLIAAPRHQQRKGEKIKVFHGLLMV